MAYSHGAERHRNDRARPDVDRGRRGIAWRSWQDDRRLLPALVAGGIVAALACALFAPKAVLPLLLLLLPLAAAAALRPGAWRTGDAPARADAAALVEARERAEQASQSKSRFLATVSHEVRTPLNGILGMTHLLARTTLSAEQESYVSAVRRSGSALFNLVEDLLDFSTIEAGKFELRQDEVDLHHLVEDVVELMAARAHEKDIEIACSIAPGTPRMVVTDNNRLRQVLFNLIGNAIKFTDAGGVRLGVRCEAKCLVFTIADTGPGLAAADQTRVFEEFEQAHAGTTRRHGGAGLGLAISSRILAAMGGRIRVESELGKGSRFIVTVPPVSETPEHPATDADALTGRRVLLALPHGQTADTLIGEIGARGGTAYHAATIAEAIDLANAAAGGITEVVVDQRLAEGAEELFAALQNVGDNTRRILLLRPIDRDALQMLQARGFDGWLVAPVRAQSLTAVLSGALGTQPVPAPYADGDGLLLSEAPSRPLDILVAEDNPVNALLMVSVLKKEGHAVTLVEDGRALVAAAFDPHTGTCPFDLIVSDLSMPRMDGAAALGLIRAHEQAQGLAPVPVVILTADGQETTRARLLSIGADFYLEKPVDPVSLLRLIARAVP